MAQDPPAQDLMHYEAMAQDALRGVVRKVLSDAAQNGLMGEHHFYVSFRTEAPGVRISQALREKYPQDMTIVLQHQFWDLNVTEHAFEVGLSFSGVPERLLVPFTALKGFLDPSVQFGLQFDTGGGKASSAQDNLPEKAENEDDALPAPVEPTEPEAPAAAPQPGVAEVVSLDKFRKK